MALCRTAAVPVIAAFLCVWTGCRSISELQPEYPSAVRVGSLSAMRVDAGPGYAVTPAGNALTLIKRVEESRTTVYVYRAVAPGHQTFVLTPRDSGPDGCISCVTVHYFITVVE